MGGTSRCYWTTVGLASLHQEPLLRLLAVATLAPALHGAALLEKPQFKVPELATARQG